MKTDYKSMSNLSFPGEILSYRNIFLLSFYFLNVASIKNAFHTLFLMLYALCALYNHVLCMRTPEAVMEK